ncbi:hypothetical protein Tco_0400857, partial [Tanacetum coccineum]
FAAGSPLLPLPSPPLPLPSPPPTSPTYDQAPLGHREAMIRKRDDILEEDMPPRRRFVLTTPPPGCDVAESSVAARAPRHQYNFVDTIEAGQGLIRSPGHDARTIARAVERAEDVGCGEVIDEMLTIKLGVAGTDEEIFTSEAWTRAFNINEPIYSELCHELYSTYEFDEIYADDELKTKKIIKFRLCGRAFSGLCSDEYFNARDYWLSISREESLSLSRSHASTIWKPILRVLHKMITYGLCQRTTGWMKRKGAGSKKESMICCGQFIIKITKRKNLLSKEVLNSLSALIYYRDLDTTTLREFIDSKGRLIPEVPEPGVPRVAIPRPPRASMQDLYDRMGSMEICQGPIERMSYRQSYHYDRYAGVFEHMAGVYSVPLQLAYNPHGFDQQQYDQYYQQYPPQQQQPGYDDE